MVCAWPMGSGMVVVGLGPRGSGTKRCRGTRRIAASTSGSLTSRAAICSATILSRARERAASSEAVAALTEIAVKARALAAKDMANEGILDREGSAGTPVGVKAIRVGWTKSVRRARSLPVAPSRISTRPSASTTPRAPSGEGTRPRKPDRRIWSIFALRAVSMTWRSGPTAMRVDPPSSTSSRPPAPIFSTACAVAASTTVRSLVSRFSAYAKRPSGRASICGGSPGL